MRELAITINDNAPLVTRADGLRLATACGNNEQAMSASELLAAALGSCVAASLVALLSRHDANAGSLRVTLRPLGESLEQGLVAIIALPPVDNALRQRCRRAALACPVRQALNIPVEFHWQDC